MISGKTREGPRRILVLDEGKADRRFLQASLEPRGFEVIMAADAAGALDCIAHRSVDLLLLHVAMPHMEGLQVCRAIRNDLKRPDLPIVLLTLASDRELRLLATEAGADDFLLKPFDEAELLARVQSLLKVKAYHDLCAEQRKAVEDELERTRSQLLHFDRLLTLGTLAAGIGHELHNVAAVLMHTAHFIRERADQDLAPDQDDLKALVRGVEHLAAHARNLLHVGILGRDRAEEIDLLAVITEVLEMFRIAGKLKGIELEIEPREGRTPITFSRIRLEQILVNVISNAVDAIVEAARQPQRIRIGVIQDATARRVRCQVEDTGTGISADALPRVFDPYFTTKPADKGTGLGLSVVRALIEAAGGSITIQSRLGEGTLASFELPLTKGTPSRLQAV